MELRHEVGSQERAKIMRLPLRVRAAARTALGACVFVLGLALPITAMTIPKETVEGYLEEGEIEKAEAALSSYLRNPAELNFSDSVYIFKHLGVLYAADPKRGEKADSLFTRLLELDPYASLHDTYASHTLVLRFQKIREAYRQRKGGRALVPQAMVFDFDAVGFSRDEREAMTSQFIAEMQKIPVFHTLDASPVREAMRRSGVDPEKCRDRECRLDIARKLFAEKLALVEVSAVGKTYTLLLTFLDVETGRVSSVVRKVKEGAPAAWIGSGLTELAVALRDEEAAWLNISLSPSSAILTLDGDPLGTTAHRFPVNPGKHEVCGSSPGYATACKTFEVGKKDALTHILALQPLGESKTALQEEKKASPGAFSEDTWGEDAAGEGGPGSGLVWGIIGGMVALAVGLFFVLGT